MTARDLFGTDAGSRDIGPGKRYQSLRFVAPLASKLYSIRTNTRSFYGINLLRCWCMQAGEVGYYALAASDYTQGQNGAA